MNAPVRRYSPLKRAGRSIEQFVRHRTTGLLARLTAQQRQSPPDWDAKPWQVLYLRHDRIGDMIVSTGLLRAIHAAHPGLALDVLASPANADVLAREPAVRAVVRFDRRSLGGWWDLWRHLRRTRYDAVIDPMVFTQSFTTLMLMLATGARWRIGIPKPRLPDVYALPAAPPADPAAHHVDHLAQLGAPFGVSIEAASTLHIPITDLERTTALTAWGPGRRLLVNVSAGKAFRAWPDDRYVMIAKHLRETVPDARVLILHAPGEGDRAQAIAAASGATTYSSTLRAALALVSTAEFVLTPDTSIVHAASAFRIPAVTLFTRDQITRWHLYRTPGQDVVTDIPTLAGIPIESVVSAVDGVLAQAGLLAPAARA
jgi:ADP-heptose:LPS heptosyltransferase